MNKEEPYRDQAEKLRRKIEKYNDGPNIGDAKLPRRRELHQKKRKATKMRIKFPLIRLLVLFFILLPITIFSIYTYLGSKQHVGVEKTSVPATGYETINVENSKK